MKDYTEGPHEAKFNQAAAMLWAIKGKCQKEGRYPSVTDKAKAKEHLRVMKEVEGAAWAEMINSSREGRGLRPDVKENRLRVEYNLFHAFFAD